MKLRLILPLLFLSLFFSTDSFSREAQQARGPWLIKKHVIKTDRGNFKFEIHFEKINLSFAQRVLEVLSSDAPKIFEYFRFVPEWTVHFIIDEANNSNGSATIFPTNIIRLNNFPPLGMEFLSSEEDWIRGWWFMNWRTLFTWTRSMEFLKF